MPWNTALDGSGQIGLRRGQSHLGFLPRLEVATRLELVAATQQPQPHPHLAGCGLARVTR